MEMKKSVPPEFKERNELSDAREEEEVGVRPPIRDTEMGGSVPFINKGKEKRGKGGKKTVTGSVRPRFPVHRRSIAADSKSYLREKAGMEWP